MRFPKQFLLLLHQECSAWWRTKV